MSLSIYPKIIDDALEELLFEEIAHILQNTSWKFGWRSANSLGETLVHWNKHVAGGGKSSRLSCDEELNANMEVRPIADAWQILKKKYFPTHSLIRCYANAHTFGLDGSIHRDNSAEVAMTTTILYCHRLWPIPWGGELVFYDDCVESIVASVNPKPNRIVIFPGHMPHVAKSPSRVCRDLRISLVFKSMDINVLS